MDEIRRLKKDQNTSSKQTTNQTVSGNNSGSSSGSQIKGQEKITNLMVNNSQPKQEAPIIDTSKLSPLQSGKKVVRECSDYQEMQDLNVEFAYSRIREILEDQRSGRAKQKIDYLVMVANRLEVSFFDLLHLLPSKSLACLFKDYKAQESALVGIMLPQNGFLSTPKSVFQEQNNQTDFANEYIAEHSKATEFNKDSELFEEGLTLQDRMRMFFSKHVIPQALHQMIDFTLDPKKQMEEILGKLEETFSISQSQNVLQRGSLGSKSDTKNTQEAISSQESGVSGSIQSQASDNIFNEKVFVTNLREFAGSLHYFMEKIYRKHAQKAETLLQNLQRIASLNPEFEIDPLLLDYNNLKRDRGVLYRLAMSGTKKLLFYYMQDKGILTKCALSNIFNFKKKEVFLDYYQHFISPYADSPEETIFRISANLENYCKALQTSLHHACALRHAIALIRFLTPLLDTFAPQFTSSSTYRYLLRALCWRVVRFILFIQNGDLSYVALVFLTFCYKVLFSERSLFYLERDRFIQLLLAFLYLFRNRQDEFFQKSKEIATKILKKLLKTVAQSTIPALTTLMSHQKSTSKKRNEIYDEDTTSNASSSSMQPSQSCSYRVFWQLNYNYPPLDVLKYYKRIEYPLLFLLIFIQFQ